jgi:hypothetical protein
MLWNMNTIDAQSPTYFGCYGVLSLGRPYIGLSCVLRIGLSVISSFSKVQNLFKLAVRNIVASVIFCWSSFCVICMLRKPALCDAEFDIQISSSKTAHRMYNKYLSMTCNWHSGGVNGRFGNADTKVLSENIMRQFYLCTFQLTSFYNLDVCTVNSMFLHLSNKRAICFNGICFL